MKIKTSEATGLALDWGLAEAEGFKPELRHGNIFVPFANFDGASLKLFSHAMPRVCMGLIKEHKITTAYWWNTTSVWSATPDDKGWDEYGDTPEQAVARCVIAMKLGDDFECPSELWVQS